MPFYIRKPTTSQVVEAEQVGYGAQAHVQGARPARPGDWIVTDHSRGETFLMDATEFASTYDALPLPVNVMVDPDLAAARRGPEPEEGIGMAGPAESFEPPPPPQTFTDRPEQPPLSQPTAPTGNTEFGLSEADTMSRPPQAPGAGDQSPTSQPIVNDLPGRPATTPTQSPRLGQDAENVPIDTPSGSPAPPNEPDKTHAEQFQEHAQQPEPGSEG